MSDSLVPPSLDLDDLLPSHHAKTEAQRVRASHTDPNTNDDSSPKSAPAPASHPNLKQQALNFAAFSDDGTPELTLETEEGNTQVSADAEDAADWSESERQLTEPSAPRHHFAIGNVEAHDVELLPSAEAEQLPLNIPVLPPATISQSSEQTAQHKNREPSKPERYASEPPLFD